MTVAVTVLAIAVGLLAVALLVSGGMLHDYVKKYLAAESSRLLLDVHSKSLASIIVERDKTIARKDTVIADKDAELWKARVARVAGADDAALDRIINGLPDEVHPSGSSSGKPAAASGSVSADPVSRGPVAGAIGDL